MLFPLETIGQLQIFFWVLIRVSVLVFLLPLFGAKGVPNLWKAGLSFVLALIMAPVVPVPEAFPETTVAVVLGVLKEGLMGLILVIGLRMMFAALQFAGQMMSFQMGFSMARAVDPMTGIQSTALSQVLYIFLVLIFFISDGHHLMIRGLAASFQMVPPNGIVFSPTLGTKLIALSGEMFVVALQIAAPIMIALFLSNLALGIVARTVPQVNILMIGFPLNIGIGLALFGILLRNLSPFLVSLTRRMGEIMMQMLHLM
jgi:flagellar biosynthetic protein FliR